MLLQRLAARALAGAMALVIFFESCTRYDITPKEEAVLADAQRRAARDAKRLRGGYSPAIGLTAEDRAFRERLEEVMQRASRSPEEARAILDEQAALRSGDAQRLDGFTLSLVRVMGDAELQAAIAAGSKEAIVSRLMVLRGEVKVDGATRERLQRMVEEYGINIENGSGYAELVPEAVVFFMLGVVFVALVVAVAVGAVTVGGVGSAVAYAVSEVKVLGSAVDRPTLLAYGSDALLVLDSLQDDTLRASVEAELAARYERDVYEYLAVAYPREDPRQLRMLASNVVKGLTGRAGQWGNQLSDR